MWLYRAYSGNLYHGGELVRTLPSFTQGDTITCILDMEAHTVSFAKNDKVWPNIYSRFDGFYTNWLLCCLVYVFVFLLGAKVSIWRCGCIWTLSLCIVLQQ